MELTDFKFRESRAVHYPSIDASRAIRLTSALPIRAWAAKDAQETTEFILKYNYLYHSRPVVANLLV